MAIFAIADLHLSLNPNIDKPMDVFGDEWKDFENILKKNWTEKVTDDDLVVIPGDISWATYLKDTIYDFEFIDKLPGTKLILKGNHDYWWSTIKKMDDFLEENNLKTIHFLMNTSFKFENKIFVGTRGWNLNDEVDGAKMIARENIRFELSIKDALKNKTDEDEMIALFHYPPINDDYIKNDVSNEFVDTMKKYNIKKCYYAHLHGASHRNAFEGVKDGIEYKLISGDYLKFNPYLISNT